MGKRVKLIDADSLKKYFFRPYSNEEVYSNVDIEEIIDTQPTVEQIRWIPCSERLPRYNERVLVKHTHFVNVNIGVLCHTHLCNYWLFAPEFSNEVFVGKRDIWMPIPSWEYIIDEYNENQCEHCIYYHHENNTCRLKKISSLGEREGYVTSWDMKFCDYFKNKDEGEER